MGSSEGRERRGEALRQRPERGRRLSPEQMARDQRRRLEGAMVEAVARHGYAGTTLRELVGLAGVSKSTFYDHFQSKEECFWTTFDGIVAGGTEKVLEAYRAASGQEGKLGAALEAYGERLVEEPEAASLVVVESLCLGREAAARRGSALAPFEQALRECYAEEPKRGEVSGLAIKGAVGGVGQIVYRSLRDRRPERLGEEVERMTSWILGYQRRSGRAIPDSFFEGLGKKRDGRAGEESEAPGWSEPPDSPRARAELSQRERILRAVAQVTCEKGYASLSVPAISGTAGVSNQTFYQEFGGKQEALLAAFDALAERALARCAEALEGEAEWRRGLAAGLAAVLRFIAEDELFARLAFFELAATGPVGLDRGGATARRFMALLARGAEGAGGKRVAEVVPQAIGGGIWTVIQSELSRGRAGELPKLAPEIVDFALVPFS